MPVHTRGFEITAVATHEPKRVTLARRVAARVAGRVMDGQCVKGERIARRQLEGHDVETVALVVEIRQRLIVGSNRRNVLPAVIVDRESSEPPSPAM